MAKGIAGDNLFDFLLSTGEKTEKNKAFERQIFLHAAGPLPNTVKSLFLCLLL